MPGVICEVVLFSHQGILESNVCMMNGCLDKLSCWFDTLMHNQKFQPMFT